MRKTAITVLVLAFVLGLVFYFSRQSVSGCVPNRGWCAGTYRGLIVGQSNYVDMTRILGEPLSSVPEADQNEPKNFIWHDYGKIKGDLQGRVGVVTDKRTDKIVRVSIAPDDLTKDDAIQYFGQDYQIMGYEFCEGFEDETAAPVYESPKAADLTYIEYRARGISISVGFDNRVSEVSFVAEPMGLASKDDCQEEAALN